jgi:hypothetical protein
LQGDRRRRPWDPPLRLFVYVTRRRHDVGSAAGLGGAVTLRDLTTRDRAVDAEPTMTARCVVGAMARALAPTSMLCPARQRQRHDGISCRTGRCRPCRSVRSLSVRRPELAPHRRSCILLAAASLLRLRTRHTALCYVPFNEGGRERNRDYVAVAELSSDTPVVMPSKPHEYHTSI